MVTLLILLMYGTKIFIYTTYTIWHENFTWNLILWLVAGP